MTMNNASGAERVRAALATALPLRPISLDYVYQRVPDLDKKTVQAAFYAHVLGFAVASRDKSKGSEDQRYFGVTFRDDAHVALPGVPRHRLNDDVDDARGRIAETCARLGHRYGKACVDYWVRSAQRRSVDVARSAMTRVRARDVRCVLCDAFGPSDAPAVLQVAHLTTRKSAFYAAVDVVEQASPGTLFTDAGVAALQVALRTDPFHSDERCMALLCRPHDRELQARVKTLVT